MTIKLEPIITFKPPMVGRDQEMERLFGFLGSAISGNGTLVLISGQAGIGKTRLLEEFTSKVPARCQALIGRCIHGAPSPYLPFVEALSGLPEGKSALDSWSQDQADARSASERMFLSIFDLLRESASKKPIVLAIEDLHWSDSSSIQLLHFLARNCQDVRLLIIGTYRPEDLVREDEKHPHPLEEEIRIMRREDLFQEISLRPLEPNDTKQAVEGMLNADVDEEVLDKIAEESDGNPLFAVETVNLLVSSRSLSFRNDAWKPLGNIQIEVPATIKDIILRRIDRLSKKERRVLEYASVIGEWFDPAMLGDALSANRLNLLEELNGIERDDKLLVESENRFRFSHEKIRRVMYEQISPSLRTELHKLIGNIMEKQDRPRYAELSSQFCRASEREKCIRYSLLAGEESMKASAAREALQFYQRALDHVKKCDSNTADYLTALEGKADAAKALLLFDQAASTYDELIQSNTDSINKPRILRKMAECWLIQGKADPKKAIEYLDEAERQPEVPLLEQGRINLAMGSLLLRTGELKRAAEYFSKAEESFEREKEMEDLGLCLLEHSVNDLSLGDAANGALRAKRSRQIFYTLGSSSNELDALVQLAVVNMHRGEYDEARRNFDDAFIIAKRFGKNKMLIRAHLQKWMMVSLLEEDVEDATMETNSILDVAPLVESKYWYGNAIGVHAYDLICLGRVGEAEKIINELKDLVKSLPPSMKVILNGSLPQMQAMIAELKESWEESNRLYEESERVYQGGYQGLMMGGVVAISYGKSLLKQGNKKKAMQEFEKAMKVFDKLQNKPQMEKIRGLMSEGCRNAR